MNQSEIVAYLETLCHEILTLANSVKELQVVVLDSDDSGVLD